MNQLNRPQEISSPPKFFLGCLQRRVCILPTLKGWIAIILLLTLMGLWAGRSAYPFLALNRPIPSDILVVEGWAPKYALEQAREEFRRGNYRTLFVTGGEIEEGSLLSEYKTYANLGATILLQAGFPADKLQSVPAPWVEKDRTYASARTLRQWMATHGGNVPSINLVSVGTHSRRSHWLFSLAFQKETQVGIIAVQNRDFNPTRWWRSSQGVRSVMDEAIAYLYARFCFRPASE